MSRREGALAVALLALLALAPLAASNVLLNFIMSALIVALAAQGWNLLAGFGGQFSFGHAAFFGTGAYAAAILQVRYGANAWAAWELWFQAWTKALAPKGPKEVRFALGTIIDFDAKGMLATASPTGRKPAVCWMVAQIKGGAFERLEPKDKGFSCEGAEFVPLG